MENIGILFIATGEKYVKAGIKAANSVLKYCPDLPIHLYTDLRCHETFFKKSTFPFTTIGIIENPHSRSKTEYLAHTPYDHTLYLDTDTSLNADIRDVFRVLERFDIAMAHAQHRGAGNLKPWRVALPDAFPEFNSGVVLFRSTPAVIKFLDDWGKHFKTDWIEAGRRNAQLEHDQTSLRELLWLSDLRIATLPPEYNVRYLKYHFLWSRSEAVTKIFHLKQFHKGWLSWFNKKSKLLKIRRKLSPRKMLNKIKKTLTMSDK
jgi:hypothetical protein